jgi:RNA polymerase sigma factor (TIGR02999 family)
LIQFKLDGGLRVQSNRKAARIPDIHCLYMDIRATPMNPDISNSGTQDSDAADRVSADETSIAAAAAELAPRLLPELRRAARGIRAGMRSGVTLQTTALINEAYLKLARGALWQNRTHFLAAAAMAMRQILVDDARARLSQRRGEGEVPLSLEQSPALSVPEAEPDERVVAVGDALERLGALNPRLARIVECRYYAGYTEAETATAMAMTERTVRRDWVKARAWLFQELADVAG